MKIISKSPERTMQLGKMVGKLSVPGDIFFLNGELGGGKTLFAKGIASALEIPINSVISPSFTIILEHRRGKFPFYHIDFYRLHKVEELVDLGLEMYLSGEGIVVIEWAERMQDVLPQGSLEVHFAWEDEQIRTIEFIPKTPAWHEIITSLLSTTSFA